MITVCTKKGEWNKSVQVLKMMSTEGLAPDVVGYNMLIKSCANADGCDTALKLVDEMWKRGLKPTTVGCNSAMTACSEALQWEKCVEMLRDIEEKGLKPDMTSYIIAIGACDRCGQVEEEEKLIKEMRSRSFSEEPPEWVADLSRNRSDRMRLTFQAYQDQQRAYFAGHEEQLSEEENNLRNGEGWMQNDSKADHQSNKRPWPPPISRLKIPAKISFIRKRRFKDPLFRDLKHPVNGMVRPVGIIPYA